VPSRHNLAARAARWSAQHRKKAIFSWLAFLVAATFLGGLTGTNTLDTEDMGNGDSMVADRIVADDGGFPDRAAEQVLVQSRERLTFADGEFKATIRDVERRMDANPYVTDLESPLLAGNAGQISEDRRSALIRFELLGDEDQLNDRVDSTLQATAAAQRSHGDLRVEQFGDASSTKALTEQFDEDFQKAERLSLPITLVILVLAFGALVAAGIPLLVGLSSVGIALGLLGPVSQLMPQDSSSQSIVLLIGLAVGVDYTMFYLRREMEERDAGRSAGAALEAAAATSGRAVLVSGVTVMVAMAGMYIAGNAVFASLATAAIMVVAVALVGSLTILPALLSKLGDKVERGRVPFLTKRRHENHEQSRAWGWILERVTRRPWITIVLAGGLLVGLTIPAFSMKTVNPGVDGLPRSLSVMRTYDRIQAAFPGGPIPAEVVIKDQDVTRAEVQKGIEALKTKAVETKGLNPPVIVQISPNKHVAIIYIPVAGTGTDKASEAAVARLREEVVPPTVGHLDAHVGGFTAGSIDFNDRMRSRLPWVFAFVLGLAFALLLVTFRSVVVPLKAIVLNLLSVGAAYGLLKIGFQDGAFEGALNFDSVGGITSWLPLFLFVVLFGLSMDYHVFILSRVREAVDRGVPTPQAVSEGIKSTAGVVTSAAMVMVAVFAIFATLSSIDFKMMGVGLATAVFIDATIVRALLLPAAMKLLGERNWYLPGWLEWLPRVSLEAPAPQPLAPAAIVRQAPSSRADVASEGPGAAVGTEERPDA
jgi:uncharacterized membrane protein YdfJ with MMPL/SSD domain